MPKQKNASLMEVGSRIKALRKERKWTQEYVCSQLRISEPAYSCLENGKTDFNLSRLQQICKLFDIPLVELLKEREIEDSGKSKNEILKAKLIKEIEDKDAEILSLQSLLVDVMTELIHQKNRIRGIDVNV